MAGEERPDAFAEGSPEREPVPRGIPPFTQTVGRVALGLIAALFIAFSLDNLHPVVFEWIFGGSGGSFGGDGVPLILLLLGSFALGAAVGAGLVWRRHRVRRVRWKRARGRSTP